MGVTSFEIERLEKIISENDIKSVIELGAQNNYATPETKNPPFMSEWFERREIQYDSIDLAGDNKSKKLNWSYQISYNKIMADLVTDFGSSEHSCQSDEYISIAFHDGYINSIYPKGQPSEEQIQLGYYYCWRNKHNLCKAGGIIFSVNPMCGYWENHGYSYIGPDFYKILCDSSGYELLEDGVVCATGNCETGKNVYGIMKKKKYDTFPTFYEFNFLLPIFRK